MRPDGRLLTKLELQVAHDPLQGKLCLLLSTAVLSNGTMYINEYYTYLQNTIQYLLNWDDAIFNNFRKHFSVSHRRLSSGVDNFYLILKSIYLWALNFNLKICVYVQSATKVST